MFHYFIWSNYAKKSFPDTLVSEINKKIKTFKHSSLIRLAAPVYEPGLLRVKDIHMNNS